MYSKIHSSFVLATLIVVTKVGNSQPGFFETPKECSLVQYYQNPILQEQCVKRYCLTNQYTFVCKSLKCKDDYVGNGITEKFAKLRCIQGVCSLNRSEKVCRMLEECEAKKKTEGLFSFIGCIIKLFS